MECATCACIYFLFITWLGDEVQVLSICLSEIQLIILIVCSHLCLLKNHRIAFSFQIKTRKNVFLFVYVNIISSYFLHLIRLTLTFDTEDELESSQ